LTIKKPPMPIPAIIEPTSAITVLPSATVMVAATVELVEVVCI
jgi:hypothetical protein